jgi:predicted component of type VI protein secretion system
MVKLVVLSAGMSGRTHELKADRTTIGRLEDNAFTVEEPSVSSHHCEVLLKGGTVTVRDLNSTNGTYIGGEKINESVLKPGQTLRLGQIEMRLESDEAPAPAPAPGSASGGAAPSSSSSTTATHKRTDPSLAMQRGVSLNELEQGGRGGGFDTKGFSKKDDKAGKIFWYLAGGFGLIIAALLIYVFAIAR